MEIPFTWNFHLFLHRLVTFLSYKLFSTKGGLVIISFVKAQTSASIRFGEDSPGIQRHISSSSSGKDPTWWTWPCSYFVATGSARVCLLLLAQSIHPWFSCHDNPRIITRTGYRRINRYKNSLRFYNAWGASSTSSARISIRYAKELISLEISANAFWLIYGFLLD